MTPGPGSGRRLRLAVLISGTGRSLKNLIDRVREGTLAAEIAGVVSSAPRAAGLDFARAAGIPCAVVEKRSPGVDGAFDDALARALDAWHPDLVVMAGFLKLWRPPLRYRGSTINIHPALLPLFGGKGFYGHRVHEAVVALGMKTSGCTVHFVDDEYDRGPVILQRSVSLEGAADAGAVAARVFAAELEALPEAIRLIGEGRVRLEGKRVVVVERQAR